MTDYEGGIGAPDAPKIEYRVDHGEWKTYVPKSFPPENLKCLSKCEFRSFDRLGNATGEDDVISFLYDDRAPGLSVSHKQGETISFREDIAVLHVRREELKEGRKVFDLEVSDAESGVLRKSASGDGVTADGAGEKIFWTPNDAGRPQYAVLKILAEDCVGNTSGRQIRLFYDPNAPVISNIRLNGAGKEEIKTNEDVTISAAVTDCELNRVSQLSSVELVNEEEDGDVIVMESAGGTYQAVLRTETFLSKTYRIVARDIAGNAARSAPLSVFIAKEAPVVRSVSMNRKPNAAGWINQDIDFEVKVSLQELWPKEIGYRLQYQKAERGKDLAGSAWIDARSQGTEKDEVCRFPFKETDPTFDGTYFFRIADEAGNFSSVLRQSVKKDKVEPEAGPGEILARYEADSVLEESGRHGFLDGLKHFFAKETITAYLYIPQDRISGVKSIDYCYDEIKTETVSAGYSVRIGEKMYAEIIISDLPKELDAQTADTLKIMKITDFAGNERRQIQEASPVAESHTVLVIDSVNPEAFADYLDEGAKWEGKKGSDMQKPVGANDPGRQRIYYGRNKGEAYKEIRLTFQERFFLEQEDEETGAVAYPSVLINGTPAKEEMIRWGTFDEAAHTVTATLFLPYADGGEAEYVLTASYRDGSKNPLLMDDPFWSALQAEDGTVSGTYQSGVIVLDDAPPELASYQIKEQPMPREIDGVKVYQNKAGNDVTISFSILERASYWHAENARFSIRDLTHGKEIVSAAGDALPWTGNGDLHAVSYGFDGEQNEAANYRAEIYYKDMAGNLMTAGETFAFSGTDLLADGTYQSEEFILDHVAPSFEIRYERAYRLVKNSDTAAENDQKNKEPETGYTAYYNSDVEVTCSVSEDCAHLEKEGAAITSLSDFVLTVNGSEEGAPEVFWNKDAQGGRYIATFTLRAEGRRKIGISYYDAAGNAMVAGTTVQGAARKTEGGTYEGETLVIDKTPPVLSLSYTDPAGNALLPSYEGEGRAYYNKFAYLNVSVKEENLRNSELKHSLLNLSAFTAEKPGAQANTQAVKFLKKITDGTVVRNASWSVPLTTEASYDIPVSFEDLAGNAAAPVTEHVCVDAKRPEDLKFSYSVEEAGYLEVNNYKSSGYAFSDCKLVLKAEADDAVSGIREIELTVTEESGEKHVITRQFKPAFHRKTSIALPLSDSNFKGSVRARVTDFSANVSRKEQGQIVETAGRHKRTSRAVITTKTKPSRTADGEDYYNSDVSLHLLMEDDYSGIGSYAYVAGSAIREAKNYKEAAGTDTDKKAAQKIVHGISRDITLASKENNQNDVVVSAAFTDNAGHKGKARETYNIDITDPVIKVTYDNEDAQNETYYKQARTATVVITERNFDENDVEFTITNTDGAMPSISPFSTSGSGDETTHTATVSFTEDGDYAFSIFFTDLAGNTAEYEEEEEFTIDTAMPEYTVSYDDAGAQNEYYYDAQRTATVDILEHNFDPEAVTATVTKDGSAAGAPSFSAWSKNGDHNTATVAFAEDGEYEFTFTGTDMAGNEMAEYAMDHFVVDMTEPEIEIFDIANLSANNGNVQPGIRYTDTNYDAQATVVTVTGFHNGEIDMKGAVSTDATGVRVKMDDFPYRQEMDDLYTMRAVVYDLAGNSSEAEVTFSVNRFGSVYTFEDAKTDELVGDEGNYYTNEKHDIVITETNVDTLQFKEITCNYNGELTTLAEGRDYTVEKSGSNESWQQYTYTVKKDLFSQEGAYALTIYSEDQAKNQSDNNAKGKKIEFVLDQTPPSVLVSGVEPNGQYREDSKTATISVEDNVLLSDVVINHDGKRKIYTREQADAEGGNISVDIFSKNDWQTLAVFASDAAGNRYAPEKIRFLVTANYLIQFLAGRPEIYVFAAGASVLAFAAVWILFGTMRKKKRLKMK